MRKASKPIIGFLAARLEEPYQHAVWTGAMEEAERLGVSLVFFGGQRVGSPEGYEALDNIVFDLAARSRVAGIVVMTNVIGTFLSREEQSAFLARLGPVSVVSIGVEFSGRPCVRVSNEGGMSAVARHLIEVHGRRDFLFLAGPERHGESATREAEFRCTATELLGPGARVTVRYCNFQEEEARVAVSEALSGGVPFDAVVAANDLMAMGALKALEDAVIDVPSAVSVTGFDDTEDSRFAVPALTTVRQPTRELGTEAIRRLAREIGLAGGEDEETRSVSFVVRESCGCPRAGAGDAVLTEADARHQASLRRAAERRTKVLREIEASLVSSFALTDILAEVARGTRALGIGACWLVLFESRGETPTWARLFLASDGGAPRILAPYGLRFRTEELLPGGLPDRWRSFVCEPLRFGEERLGYLVCVAGGNDRRAFEALRDQASSAIKGALLMAAERDRERRLEQEVRSRTVELTAANERLTEEMERRSALERELLDVSNDIMGRIGRDIHDDLCQDIAGIGLMAALLEGSLRRSDVPQAAAAAESAAAIAAAASRTASRAKGMARGLYPAELEAKGLVEAVAELARSAGSRSAASIRMEVTSGFFLKDSEKALQLYRIVQEALGNAVAHSRAAEIVVSLRMDREAVLVEVADDGVGLGAADEGRRRGGLGMGLRIMKYRASVIGGELKVRSKDRGCAVSCRVAR